MGIMAIHAVGGRKWLALMRLNQTGILRIVTIDAQRGSVLGQVVINFALASLTRLVRDMTGVAPHVESGVAAALLRDIRSLRVAGEAKIVFLFPGGRLQ